eukprot:snap_masked-scaffold_21-processed-gene-2.10-mRNA-1 protein AED:1.00 eAED:1.00 QI:0/-1/0/0/-1/1/1/0/94
MRKVYGSEKMSTSFQLKIRYLLENRESLVIPEEIDFLIAEAELLLATAEEKFIESKNDQCISLLNSTIPKMKKMKQFSLNDVINLKSKKAKKSF